MKIEISRFFYGYLLTVWGGAACHYAQEMNEPFWSYTYAIQGFLLIGVGFWQWWKYFTYEEPATSGSSPLPEPPK